MSDAAGATGPRTPGPGGPDTVDWDLAVTTAERLVRPGPAVTRDEARAVVADLHRHAVAAQRHVRDVTGLHAPAGGASGVAVIDRPGWVRANAAGFRTLLEPLAEVLKEKRGGRTSALAQAVGPRVTAVETGALLAFLSGKVLGQYELFPPWGGDADPGAAPAGRLLLVAPNVVQAERDMGVDPRDFRLWVCVHEETHRVQFGAVPWLRTHLVGEVRALVEATDVDPAVLLRRLRTAAGAVGDALRAGPEAAPDGGTSLLEAVQSPRQREVLDRITALMSLLEGHADVVMDAVGPAVIPSVAQIRERFQRRREGSGRLDVALRRLLGLDAKMRQYRDGARFVEGVVARVGMDGFNTVWTSPETLPTRAELADPAAWVARTGPRRIGA
ncbi:zinc-dependent metalloprotease [Vallicoccus soli]|uniref:Coenzyme F420 biosynthesis-associated protein n=1 Tax=Vallicoccus soli TaxID=2339232 RepID=A0A3A3Z3C6_9ACTN|nr:zinc-dependent metalloprotease [Vallicoccus soli]RJK96025.1 coenzyme F420 biosynthesis-associated protein [Vallicoccus soli]